MSVAGLRRDYADRWFEYVQTVAERLDEARERLAPYLSNPVYERSASSVSSTSRVAVDGILEVVRVRTVHFPIGRSVRSGLHWERLEKEYVLMCMEISGVGIKLSMDIGQLLHEEGKLPLVSQLSVAQRAYLASAQTQLHSRAIRFLAQVESIFITGQRAQGSIVSSMLSLEAN